MTDDTFTLSRRLILGPVIHINFAFKKSQASDPITEQLYQAIMNDGTLSYAAYGEQIGVSEATIKRRLGELKKSGLIVRVGANKNGHWEVLTRKTNIS